MGKIEERTKLAAKWAQLFDDKAAIEAEAFTRWDEGFKGLTVEQIRQRYLTKRIFTAEEEARVDAIVSKIENVGETIKVLDEAIHRDVEKTREKVILAPGRHNVEPEYRTKW